MSCRCQSLTSVRVMRIFIHRAVQIFYELVETYKVSTICLLSSRTISPPLRGGRRIALAICLRCLTAFPSPDSHLPSPICISFTSVASYLTAVTFERRIAALGCTSPTSSGARASRSRRQELSASWGRTRSSRTWRARWRASSKLCASSDWLATTDRADVEEGRGRAGVEREGGRTADVFAQAWRSPPFVMCAHTSVHAHQITLWHTLVLTTLSIDDQCMNAHTCHDISGRPLALPH